MPPEVWRLRIQDIIDSIDRIEVYLSGISHEWFTEDQRTRDAVVWNIAVICEAARLIPVEIQVNHQAIPWAKMRGMRNIVMHEYFGIDESIIWETATRDLPTLRAQLEKLVLSERDR